MPGLHSFHCSSELEVLLAELGFDAVVVQLQPGLLAGELGVATRAGLPVLRLQCNLALSLSCARRPQVIPLSVDRYGAAGRVFVHGQGLVAHAVAGGCLSLTQSFVQLWPGAVALIALVPSEPLLEQLLLGSGSKAAMLMEAHNQLVLAQAVHQEMAAWLMDWFEPKAPLELDPVTQLAVWLRDEHIEKAIRFKTVARYERVFELLKYGANSNLEGVELEQLAEQFQISRSSLIQGCKDLTGYGPIQLLRLQRLERVHQMLRQGRQEESFDSASVAAVAERFGFLSRGHFAAAYKKQYGQSPSQTLNQAA